MALVVESLVSRTGTIETLLDISANISASCICLLPFPLAMPVAQASADALGHLASTCAKSTLADILVVLENFLQIANVLLT